MDGDFDRDHEQDRGPFKEPAKDGEGPVNWKREASQPPEGGRGTQEPSISPPTSPASPRANADPGDPIHRARCLGSQQVCPGVGGSWRHWVRRYEADTLRSPVGWGRANPGLIQEFQEGAREGGNM